MRDVEVPIPGGRLHVWYRPAAPGAPTAVLIHGLTGNSRWWSRVIEHLPEELGVIAPDLRGRGGSVDAPPPFDLATLADDVALTLDHFGVERAIVVGYSMGGWTSAIFGDRHPDRVGRVVLLDGGLALPEGSELEPEAIIQGMVGPALARLDIEFPDETACTDYWKAHPALRRHWQDEMAPALLYELVPSEAGHRVSVNPEAIWTAARQITVDPETKNAAAGVNVPSLLVVVERGTADEEGGMTPRHLAEAAAAANPRLEMHYLEDLNHYTLVLGDGASAVAALISALASV